MKILSWNCRGLGSPSAVRSLLELQRQHDPNVIFLSETHLDDSSGERLRVKLGFESKFVSPSDGRSGGLMILCKSNINMQLNYFHANFIDVVVKGDGPSHDWRLTGMYGEPVWRNKHRTWKWIHDRHAKGNLPWVVIGDLNEILYSSEKEGGNARPMSYMTAFRECLSDCLLEDLGYIGNKFTWKKGGHEKD